jgi:crotonobetainyl-CoA:carnitine CoA-transferase CaiB-like acyl-CoA transferase
MANGAWSNSCQIQAAFCNAEPPVRSTRKLCANPLVNHYLSRDGQRFLLCLLDIVKDWPRLCSAVRLPELIGDARFCTTAQRAANGPELVQLLDREFAREDMAEWKRRFIEGEVIWSPVPSFEQIAGDEQMELNGVFTELANAPGGPIRTVNNPITVEGSEKVAPKMPPAVGEHSTEILRSIGYSDEAIEELVKRGVTLA